MKNFLLHKRHCSGGQWRVSDIDEREHCRDCSAAGVPAGRTELREFCSVPVMLQCSHAVHTGMCRSVIPEGKEQLLYSPVSLQLLLELSIKV